MCEYIILTMKIKILYEGYGRCYFIHVLRFRLDQNHLEQSTGSTGPCPKNRYISCKGDTEKFKERRKRQN